MIDNLFKLFASVVAVLAFVTAVYLHEVKGLTVEAIYWIGIAIYASISRVILHILNIEARRNVK
jgi:hypothetical protein